MSGDLQTEFLDSGKLNSFSFTADQSMRISYLLNGKDNTYSMSIVCKNPEGKYFNLYEDNNIPPEKAHETLRGIVNNFSDSSEKGNYLAQILNSENTIKHQNSLGLNSDIMSEAIDSILNSKGDEFGGLNLAGLGIKISKGREI